MKKKTKKTQFTVSFMFLQSSDKHVSTYIYIFCIYFYLGYGVFTVQDFRREDALLEYSGILIYL